VFFLDDGAVLKSLPRGWTDHSDPDPLVAMAAGRSPFRCEDLLALATVVGEHPCPVDKKKLRKVDLHHLSWSQIHTEAVIERVNRSVTDPDQAWILAELIRYLEHPRSGAVDFDDMGASWVAVRDGATNGTLRPNDPHTLDVASRFGQLVAFAGMRLSRKLGVEVRPALTRAQLADGPKRVQAAAGVLVDQGLLEASLRVPNAISPIELIVDLKSGRVTCEVVVDAPAEGRPTTRIKWLLRQLCDGPRDLVIETFPLRARTGICQTLASAADAPELLFEDPKREIKAFALRLSSPIGTKRGQGRGSFVGSVLSLVDAFYIDIVQNLKPWSPPAPTVRNSSSGHQEPDEDSIQGELPVRPNRKELDGKHVEGHDGGASVHDEPSTSPDTSTIASSHVVLTGASNAEPTYPAMRCHDHR
jgi:hypothetical protein